MRGRERVCEKLKINFLQTHDFKGHNLQPQKEHNFKGLFAKIAIEGFYIPNEKILLDVAVFLDY